MKHRILIILSIVVVGFAAAQEDKLINKLNDGFEQNIIKNQYEVLAYKSMWSAKNKSGAIIIIYEDVYEKNKIFKNLNWDEFQTLLYTLKNNTKVIFNSKSNILHSPYRRTGNQERL